VRYAGPIQAEVTTTERGPVSFIAAMEEVFKALSQKAIALDTNSVVSLEITIDPFAKRQDGTDVLSIYACGTATTLEFPPWS